MIDPVAPAPDVGADRSAALAGLLRRILEMTAEDLDLRDVVRRVAALIIEADGADVCFVHLVDEARGCLVLAGATPPFDELAGTIELAIGEGVAGWVARHGKPLVVDDKWRDPRYKYIPALRGQDYTSLVSLPMVRRGNHVVGVVNVHSKARRRHSPEEVALLTDVAGLLGGVVENARLYSRLAEREAELERFAARTIELQELERRRVAADIHDGISQRLVSLWYHLSAADEALASSPEVVAAELAASKDLATAALDEARRTIAGLRPAVLDDLGLGPGLESLATSVPGLDIVVDIEAPPLPAHVETALFRIAQEALQNVAKHAGAATVGVELRSTPAGVRLVVADDGAGFDVDRTRERARPDAYGLAGMQERAALVGGRVTVASRMGEG
ncbi:MAG: GAF domain-containing sensor histidine kinase, partial [Actinomycetota bacterium]|nr:GAF domain-containing sensor histidine kinase [Actinomycetota bacterium]